MPEFFSVMENPLRRLARYAEEVRRDVGMAQVHVLLGFKQEFTDLAVAELTRLHTYLAQTYLDPRQPVAPVFQALLQRYVNQTTQLVNNAFSTAIDTIPELVSKYRAKIAPGGPKRSILARVNQAVLGLPPDEPPPSPRTLSEMFFDGENYYDVQLLLKRFKGATTTQVQVDRLDFSTAHGSGFSEERIELTGRITRPDPPLVVYTGGRYLVIDGRHRVVRAQRAGELTIDAIVISRGQLNKTKLGPNESPLIVHSAGRELYGYVRGARAKARVVRITLLAYLRMLFRQIPRNYERDFRALLLRMQVPLGDEVLYQISPGVGPNSCDTCTELNGRVLTTDAMRYALTRLVPQLYHPNCFPGWTVVSSPATVRVADSRQYEGEVVVIATAFGKQLTVTPQHPILTARGWVPAAELAIGQELVCDAVDVDGDGTIPPHEHEVSARFEDLFRALRDVAPVLPVRVPAASHNFHGDGAGSDVDVVLADRLLRETDNAPFDESGEYGSLSRAAMQSLLLLGQGALTQVGRGLFSAANRDVRLRDLLRTLRRRESAPNLARGGGAVCLATDAHKVHRNARLRNAEGLCDLVLQGTGAVAFDKVVDLSRRQFSGHVYNLHTTAGWYRAEGVIVKNCVHKLSPVLITLATYDERKYGKLVTLAVLKKLIAQGRLQEGPARPSFVSV